MIEHVPIKDTPRLEAYDQYPSLIMALHQFREESAMLAPKLKGRRIWMVNSTATGGGVAEMMPRMGSLMRQIGLDLRWVVINTQENAFFDLTKNLHNLIHGAGKPQFSEADRQVFEQVNRENADSFLPEIEDGDIVVIHDPQPMAMAGMLKAKRTIKTVWRCHIGLDQSNVHTQAAWDFLSPYLADYDRVIFTAPEYIPPQVSQKVSIITPAIDPLSHKNRTLYLHKLSGILIDSGLTTNEHPPIAPPFEHQVQRVRPGGSFGPATEPEPLGLMFRPIVTEISRWDRLKGWLPLMQGFAHLKQTASYREVSERHRRRLDLCRLVLAGPDPAFIADDPEGKAMLEELIEAYKAMPADLQKDIAILMIPMESRKENALIINALQRCSSVVVQNSIQEGFGLTVTEALWKGIPVLGSKACGIRQQLREGIDGHYIEKADDPVAIADALNYVLSQAVKREVWGFNAKRHTIDNFLVFTQIRKYMQLFVKL
ncbi:MAG: glycosyltransferase [Bacteroidetes bacterium]|nr:MAG: glycosyltransferase [Bacteroidota bacterium]